MTVPLVVVVVILRLDMVNGDAIVDDIVVVLLLLPAVGRLQY